MLWRAKILQATLPFLLQKEIIGMKITSGILDSFSNVKPALLFFLTLSWIHMKDEENQILSNVTKLLE